METTEEEYTILDEALSFVTRHVHLPSENQAIAMVLYAAATHVIDEFPAFGRMLFTADKPESGKTTAMDVMTPLCSNPQSAEGSTDGLASTLAEATNAPETGVPTLTWDEVEKFWGPSGLNKPSHLFHDVATKGYKRGKTRTRSVNRAKARFSIYTPILMTGLQVAVPTDVRTRCIVIHCEPGEPQEYFDARESEPLAYRYGSDMNQIVQAFREDIADFRALGLHPKLVKRNLEIWEPLFAVANAVGGQRWLNKCMDAFTELVGAGDQVVLTVRQQLIRDAVDLLDGPLARQAAHGFIAAESLASELGRLNIAPYDMMGDNALLQHVAANMTGFGKRQMGGLLKAGCYPLDRMMVYSASDIRDEWEKIRPDKPSDVEIPEARNPFAVNDDDVFEELPGLSNTEPEIARGARGARGGATGTTLHDSGKGEPGDSILVPPCETDDLTPRRSRRKSVEERFKVETLKET
jgi:hypothetical protein